MFGWMAIEGMARKGMVYIVKSVFVNDLKGGTLPWHSKSPFFVPLNWRVKEGNVSLLSLNLLNMDDTIYSTLSLAFPFHSIITYSLLSSI